MKQTCQHTYCICKQLLLRFETSGLKTWPQVVKSSVPRTSKKDVAMSALTDTAMKEFSRRLYKFMTEQGMSQSDLARKVWGETDDPRGFKVAKNRD